MALEDDPYAQVVANKLKLKTDDGIKKKKKSSKKKLKQQAVKTIDSSSSDDHQTKSASVDQQKTKAELAFIKQQEKMRLKRIMEKAAMTHKERVEQFNQHLDNLTEHFDIPKVSWTK